MLPHTNTITVHYGASLQVATHAIILLHGRGGTPSSIAIPLITTLLTPSTESKLRIVAPAAQDRTWYPHVYTTPQSENEPWLTAAVDRVEKEVRTLENNGITRDKIIIGGFSQGACLTAMYLLKYPAKYWGAFIFSGAIPGLFSYVMEAKSGDEGEFDGVDLRGTRVFVGCGDSDPLIRARAAEWTAWVFQGRGAEVKKQIYEGLGHSVCKEELEVLKSWVQEMATED
jgi:predicted esterase